MQSMLKFHRTSGRRCASLQWTPPVAPPSLLPASPLAPASASPKSAPALQMRGRRSQEMLQERGGPKNLNISRLVQTKIWPQTSNQSSLDVWTPDQPLGLIDLLFFFFRLHRKISQENHKNSNFLYCNVMISDVRHQKVAGLKKARLE